MGLSVRCARLLGGQRAGVDDARLVAALGRGVGADRGQRRDLRYPRGEEPRGGGGGGETLPADGARGRAARAGIPESGTGGHVPGRDAAGRDHGSGGYTPSGLPVLGFLNRERAGTFRDAMLPDGTTDLAATRRPGTKKYGFGLNVEQEVARDIGAFARYGWSDGKTESWAFTQIDRSVSGGISLQGRIWKRTGDNIGVAAVRNYLTGDERRFLAAGGMGFIIGDGKLNYAPESITEAYYAWHASRDWTFTLDYQRVVNPAYNQDRGPVSVGTLRVHWER